MVVSDSISQGGSQDYSKTYCLFCSSGHEEKVAQHINSQYENVLALPVFQVKHRSEKGVKTLVKEVMLPGYVFVYSSDTIPMTQILLNSKTLKFLKDSEGTYELYGGNLEYAQWVLRYNGIIGCSKAVRIGSRIKVIDGPLKDYEGYIKEVSKKNRNARIEMMFMGRMISAWLPFEWVEDALQTPAIPAQ